MNRAQRRQLKKQFKGQQVVMNPGEETIDRSKSRYCWRHNLKLDNIDHPTERDKRLIESVRLKPFKRKDENGKLVMGRRCGRCFNEILLSDRLLSGTKETILEVPKDNEYADLRMPNVPLQV